MLCRKDLDLGCVVLAGGKSSRMGQDKALLSYQGGSFLERICQTL
ncbi:MAG: NTP transferase domain-containing protein, partial [Agathobacter sp.]|nr:NTP transferase domain-containing protein [Agathobacter sp.]